MINNISSNPWPGVDTKGEMGTGITENKLLWVWSTDNEKVPTKKQQYH